MESRQQPEEPRHHGRMTPDEMEAAIRELLAWKAEVEQRIAAATAPRTEPSQ